MVFIGGKQLSPKTTEGSSEEGARREDGATLCLSAESDCRHTAVRLPEVSVRTVRRYSPRNNTVVMSSGQTGVVTNLGSDAVFSSEWNNRFVGNDYTNNTGSSQPFAWGGNSPPGISGGRPDTTSTVVSSRARLLYWIYAVARVDHAPPEVRDVRKG